MLQSSLSPGAVRVSAVDCAQGIRGLDSVLPSTAYGTARFLLCLSASLCVWSSALEAAEAS